MTCRVTCLSPLNQDHSCPPRHNYNINMDRTPLSRKSSAIDRINRNISISSLPSSRSEAIIQPMSNTLSLQENDIAIDMKRLRRARRRRDPNRVKSILKKTSSYGGQLCAGNESDDNSTASRSSTGFPKKRVSFPGLANSRWDSQGAMSQSLKAPGAMRWQSQSREEPQSNHVWKVRGEASSPFPASSLNDLYLRARRSRVSPVVEDKRKVAIQQAFQNITLSPP